MISFDSDQVDIAELAVLLRRACARHGLQLSTATAIDLHDAYRHLPTVGPQVLYFASRALCVHRPEERAPFDLAFSELIDQMVDDDGLVPDGVVPDGLVPDGLVPDEATVQSRGGESSESEADREEEATAVVAAYSRHEYLQDRDIASCSAQELEMINAVLTNVARRQSRAFRRRMRARTKASHSLDFRGSIDHARSTDGELIELVYRTRRTSLRRVVFLVDISGSMESYVPAFLRLIYGISRSELRVEIFSLGTRLTRLSRALVTASVDEALGEIQSSVRDWSGGTRLGESLGYFNDVFGVRGLARGATVVIVSDGLDRGDPEMLGRQMQRLHFVARQVIWVNPLKAGESYQPLARGMSAALPHVDHFISGHSLSSLTDLVGLIYRATSLPLVTGLS